MTKRYTALDLGDLKALRQGVLNTTMSTERQIRCLEALNEAICIADTYHPDEYVVLGRGVFKRSERQKRRIAAKRIEEILQLYKFSIEPVWQEHIHQGWVVWVDGGRGLVGTGKTVKEAVSMAVAAVLQRQANRCEPISA